MTQLRLIPAMATHVGMRRRHNEDSIGYRYPDTAKDLRDKGAMFVVADGVGGLSAGEKASSMTVDNLLKHYYTADTGIPIEKRLAKVVQKVNGEVYMRLNDPGRPAATTLVAIVVSGNKLYAVSVGDSQIFLVRNDEIRQLNEMDVLSDGSADDGALTKAMGYHETLEVETISGTLEPNDILILCSDGLTRYLDEAQLTRLSRLRDPRDSVRRMINEANQKGGADNISAVVVHVGQAVDDEDISKHVQHLIVRVSVDTQPLITPEVETKPHTNIPSSRPEPQVPETVLPQKNPLPPETYHSQNTGRYKVSEPSPNSKRDMTIGFAVAILVVGALVFFGALFFLSRGDDETPADPTAIENSVDVTEQANPTMSATDEIIVDNQIDIGDSVTVTSAIPTYVGVEETVGSFVTVPNTPYLVEEIFEDSEGQLWYRLLDEDSEQIGWIAASDVSLVE